jgi:hemerythrin
MQWDEKYETGNEIVDRDHRQLFQLVQKVLDAAFDSHEEKVEETLNFLADYALNHFAHEEQLMEESAYPDAEAHKALHNNFIKEFLLLKDRIVSESDTLRNHLDINKVIVNWLNDHVLGSDKLMAEHYREWFSSH